MTEAQSHHRALESQTDQYAIVGVNSICSDSY